MEALSCNKQSAKLADIVVAAGATMLCRLPNYTEVSNRGSVVCVLCVPRHRSSEFKRVLPESLVHGKFEGVIMVSYTSVLKVASGQSTYVVRS